MIIRPNEIHLWHTQDEHITDSPLIHLYHQYLSDEESKQQKRFHFEKHKHQYLITRALVRSVLSLYDDNISPEAWEFKSNAYGKPYISNANSCLPLCFNLSHTENFIVLAVSLSCDVGIDVEYLPRHGAMEEIAESFFSKAEVIELKKLPKEQQKQRFYDLWTLKEAYIKACGMGLSIPLNHFSYDFTDKGKIDITFAPERNDASDDWHFWQGQPMPEYKLSLAMKKQTETISVSCWETVPQKSIKEASYPIAYGHVIQNI